MRLGGSLRIGLGPSELFVCVSQCFGRLLAALLGGTEGASGAVGTTPGLGFVGLGDLARLRPLAGRELRGVRRFASGGRKLSADSGAEANMAELALQTPLSYQCAGILAKRGGVQRLADSLEDRWTELVPLGAEQATGLVEQNVDGRSFALGGLAQRTPLSAPGEHA
jgi:hypothetical protein